MSEKAKSPRQQVFDLYLKEGLGRREIIKRMQGILAPESVATYVKQAGIYAYKEGIDTRLRPRKEEPVVPRSFSARGPISNLHVRVGARLSLHRSRADLDARQYSSKHRLGNQKSIREMELGLYEFTLSELVTIAAVIGTDVHALLQPTSVDAHRDQRAVLDA